MDYTGLMRQLLLNAEEAAHRLRDGQLIAYPTEAVYGLGCDPVNESAVRKLLALKQRPESAGLILIGYEFEQFKAWTGPVNARQRARAMATWPGPVSWLFPRGRNVPTIISGSHDTIAIRVTAHPPCVALCRAFGGALVSTSANPRSAAPAISAGEVEDYFGNFLGGILEGPLGGRAGTSEIRDLMTGKLIRKGSKPGITDES